MVEEKKKRWPVFPVICWAFFILASLAILGLAATPAGESSQESGFFMKIFTSIVNAIFPGLINEGNADAVHAFLRKAVGHFGLFGFAGSWGYLAFAETVHHPKANILFVALEDMGVGLILAFGSEGIQRIPALHRSGEFRDVGIDSLGFLCGLLIALLIYELIQAHRRKVRPSGDTR